MYFISKRSSKENLSDTCETLYMISVPSCCCIDNHLCTAAAIVKKLKERKGKRESEREREREERRRQDPVADRRRGNNLNKK